MEEIKEELSEVKEAPPEENTGGELPTGLPAVQTDGLPEVQTYGLPEEKEDTLGLIKESLSGLTEMVRELQECFDSKIEEDEHKNKLFDNMHRELNSYHNGAHEKIIDTMALDLIQVIDSVKQNHKVYSAKEFSEENYGKLLRAVEGIAQDLDDILYRQSIEPFTVEGEDVDVKRQKILRTVNTDSAELDNKLAERSVCGYEKEGRVLRQERISIYKFKPADNTPQS